MSAWSLLVESPEEAERVRQWGTAEAWARWREASCVEWNGGHLWVLTIDQGYASVRCSCGAEPYPDCAEVLVGEFPVHVTVTTEVYRNPEGTEYDVWVEVEPS